MSLRAQAETDLASTLEAIGDFGLAFTITDPAGLTSSALVGQSGDIAALIDPDTGQAVTGRLAHLVVRISSFLTDPAGFTDLPVGIADQNTLPWVVSFLGVSTPAFLWKVKHSRPDRTLGIVTLVLEFYEVA